MDKNQLCAKFDREWILTWEPKDMETNNRPWSKDELMDEKLTELVKSVINRQRTN